MRLQMKICSFGNLAKLKNNLKKVLPLKKLFGEKFSVLIKFKFFLIFCLSEGSLFGISKIEQSALKGNLESQLLLGNLYAQGGSYGERQQSLFWFRKAAKQDNEHACLVVGRSYLQGYGTKKDLEKASQWISCVQQLWVTRNHFII